MEELKKKNASLERDVQRIKERESLLAKITQLKIKMVVVNFTQKQEETKLIDQRKKDAEKALREFEKKLKPLQQKKE